MNDSWDDSMYDGGGGDGNVYGDDSFVSEFLRQAAAVSSRSVTQTVPAQAALAPAPVAAPRPLIMPTAASAPTALITPSAPAQDRPTDPPLGASGSGFFRRGTVPGVGQVPLHDLDSDEEDGLVNTSSNVADLSRISSVSSGGREQPPMVATLSEKNITETYGLGGTSSQANFSNVDLENASLDSGELDRILEEQGAQDDVASLFSAVAVSARAGNNTNSMRTVDEHFYASSQAAPAPLRPMKLRADNHSISMDSLASAMTSPRRTSATEFDPLPQRTVSSLSTQQDAKRLSVTMSGVPVPLVLQDIWMECMPNDQNMATIVQVQDALIRSVDTRTDMNGVSDQDLLNAMQKLSQQMPASLYTDYDTFVAVMQPILPDMAPSKLIPPMGVNANAPTGAPTTTMAMAAQPQQQHDPNPTYVSDEVMARRLMQEESDRQLAERLRRESTEAASAQEAADAAMARQLYEDQAAADAAMAGQQHHHHRPAAAANQNRPDPASDDLGEAADGMIRAKCGSCQILFEFPKGCKKVKCGSCGTINKTGEAMARFHKKNGAKDAKKDKKSRSKSKSNLDPSAASSSGMLPPSASSSHTNGSASTNINPGPAPLTGPKRRGVLLKMSTVGKHWKARHFLLQSNQLIYGVMRDENTQAKPKTERRGSIKLSKRSVSRKDFSQLESNMGSKAEGLHILGQIGLKASMSVFERNKTSVLGHSFELHDPNGKSYKFDCDSEENRREWINDLKVSIECIQTNIREGRGQAELGTVEGRRYNKPSPTGSNPENVDDNVKAAYKADSKRLGFVRGKCGSCRYLLKIPPGHHNINCGNCGTLIKLPTHHKDGTPRDMGVKANPAELNPIAPPFEQQPSYVYIQNNASIPSSSSSTPRVINDSRGRSSSVLTATPSSPAVQPQAVPAPIPSPTAPREDRQRATSVQLRDALDGAPYTHNNNNHANHPGAVVLVSPRGPKTLPVISKPNYTIGGNIATSMEGLCYKAVVNGMKNVQASQAIPGDAYSASMKTATILNLLIQDGDPDSRLSPLVGISAVTSDDPVPYLFSTRSRVNGTLGDVLRRHGLNIMPHVRLKIAVQICAGMQKLAQYGVVHGCFASMSVVPYSLDVSDASQLDCKVGEYWYDCVGRSITNTNPIIRWMAPELLQGGTVSTQSDVWSFATVIWEVFNGTGRPPFAQLQDEMELIQRVTSGTRLGKPARMPQDVYELLSQCWNTAPARRPSFADLHQRLLYLYNKEVPPPRVSNPPPESPVTLIQAR